jgi:hypothetical protein
MAFPTPDTRAMWSSIDAEDLNALDDIETKCSRVDIPAVEPRMLILMQGLRSIATLQMDVTNAQIAFREKRREASFQREVVSNCDAKFMMALQKLIVGSRRYEEDTFERLQKLVERCQAARDELGPVEQEVIEAELRWEGQTWSLRQAEIFIYQHFDAEFQRAALFPPASQSTDFSGSSLPSEPPDKDIADVEFNDASRLAIPNDCGVRAGEHLQTSFEACRNIQESKTAAQDFFCCEHVDNLEQYDHDLQESDDSESSQANAKSNGRVNDLVDKTSEIFRDPEPTARGGQLYQDLLTDFVSKRDRVNKWIESNVLDSRIEATSVFTILKDKLDMEQLDIPSNWAQLGEAFLVNTLSFMSYKVPVARRILCRS